MSREPRGARRAVEAAPIVQHRDAVRLEHLFMWQKKEEKEKINKI